MTARALWFVTGALFATALLLLFPRPEQVPQRELQGVRDAIVLPDNHGAIPAGAVSNLYPLIFERIAAPMPAGRAGALATAGDMTLLMTRQGQLMRLRGQAFEPLDIAAPFDLPEMERTLPIARIRQRMGVYDLATRRAGEDWELFVSYAHHDSDTGCLRLAVAGIRLPAAALDGAGTDASWRTVFMSEPCVDTHGNQIALLGGGALAITPQGKLLLGVGTFALNGKEAARFLRSDETDYGKLVEIDPGTGASRHFAKGLRDPDGLVVAPDGTIWSTEHGPRGGDELNLVREGGDYGWPLSTYGTNYGEWSWPLDPDTGRHSRFDPPVWAWVPSPGISSALMVRGTAFPMWRGDLLVSSLKAGMIYRVRLRDGRVVLVEPIFVGDRIRDIVETSDGAILVLLDRFDFVVKITNANLGPSASRFTEVPYQVAYCIGCHKVKPGDPGMAAPLTGVIGRAVAADPDLAWSDALRAAGGTWTRDRVADFLEQPQRFAPGTTHPNLGLAPFRLFETVEWLRTN